jgi:hypothetical protein
MSTHDERPEWELPDSALADSAMQSGSDAGEPGEHLGPAGLDPDERRLLEALESDTTAPAPEDLGELILEERAAEDDGPLPERGGPQSDGLDARFSDPEDRLPE